MPVNIQWAKPADLAGDYLSGVQTASQIQEAQQRLQAQADARSQEMQVQQQRLQVEQAYHQQEVSLRKQQLDQAQAVNNQKTKSAAQAYHAKQQWQQALNDIDGNPNLSDEQKNTAKTQAIMRLAPMMGMAGTEASQMLRNSRATAPAKVEDAGDFMKVTQPNGQVSLRTKPKQQPAPDPNVKVQVDVGSPPVTMRQSQARAVIPKLPDELRTNAVNSAVGATAPKQAGKKVTATNPKTGEKMELIDGKWQPLTQ